MRMTSPADEVVYYNSTCSTASGVRTCTAARSNYTEGRAVAVAGRITAHRDMGKSMFIDVKDQSGRIQAYAQKNVLGDEQFGIFQHLDLADFIGVKGTLFNQFPSRIYLDGKFTSAANYAKI